MILQPRPRKLLRHWTLSGVAIRAPEDLMDDATGDFVKIGPERLLRLQELGPQEIHYLSLGPMNDERGSPLAAVAKGVHVHLGCQRHEELASPDIMDCEVMIFTGRSDWPLKPLLESLLGSLSGDALTYGGAARYQSLDGGQFPSEVGFRHDCSRRGLSAEVK